jgi:hypothetical protein
VLIDEKAALQKSYDDKIRAAKVSAFQSEKESNIIQAIMNTALELTKTLAEPWMYPVVAALGAAQIAVIASQPTPKFHTGGIVMPGGSGREFPILVRGGESVRTEAQEREVQSVINDNSAASMVNHFHFHGAVTNEEGIKRVIENIMERVNASDVSTVFVNRKLARTIR